MDLTSKNIKTKSGTETYLFLLDLIRTTGSRQLTARDILNNSKVGYTRTILWLKYLREAIDQQRPYVKGYRYSTKLNKVNNRQIFVYWHESN